MKYLIIGAGGTGGPLGAYLHRAGREVLLIARGQHLQAIQEEGLRLEKAWEEPEALFLYAARGCSSRSGCALSFSVKTPPPELRRHHTVTGQRNPQLSGHPLHLIDQAVNFRRAARLDISLHGRGRRGRQSA